MACSPNALATSTTRWRAYNISNDDAVRVAPMSAQKSSLPNTMPASSNRQSLSFAMSTAALHMAGRFMMDEHDSANIMSARRCLMADTLQWRRSSSENWWWWAIRNKMWI